MFVMSSRQILKPRDSILDCPRKNQKPRILVKCQANIPNQVAAQGNAFLLHK